MTTMVLPRWRLILTGGGLILLAAVGLGAVNAATTPRPGSDANVAAAANALLADPAGGTGTSTDAALLRPRRLGRALVHGTIILDLPQKGLTTVQVDHGKVSAVGSNSLTISEAGNSTVTVATSDKTRVRKNAGPAKLSDLKVGDEVFVVSEVEGQSTTAYRILVPRAPQP